MMNDDKERAQKNRMENKKEALEVLAKMNEMLRDRPMFGDIVKDERFLQLNDRLHELGWLGFSESLERGKNGELYTQLRLVDPDSEEGQTVP